MSAPVLIVDDDEAVREAMHEFITRAGFQAYSAPSAEAALEMLKNLSVDIVITDILMPGMDGLQLTEIVKNDHDSDVIVMTGYSGDYSYEEAINKGASDFVFKPVRFEELLLRLKRVLKERQMARERARMLGELQNLAITDGLTKLYNSRHFYNQLDTEMGRCQRYRHPLSLMLMDIDHFKNYNDTYGHLEGDKVLVRIAKIISDGLRTIDSAYRYGGEEFTTILPETRGEEAQKVAQRLRSTVAVEIFHPEPNTTASVTISIGVTELRPREKKSEFVQRADQAMYLSKQNGRNQVTYLPAD